MGLRKDTSKILENPKIQIQTATGFQLLMCKEYVLQRGRNLIIKPIGSYPYDYQPSHRQKLA